uniref:Uncharacterized protein ycf83 n=2 Tax=Pyropia yezoensis TaxID=2788 RepID=YCF83_PYRYE|nr:hypothetical protein 114 [Neopyropia yezoensis]Q1XDR9.1 RecName: Full=Uncharacterized protein ycf83 [Neopyropia yezoensis]BAE92342.1 unnamed protein product [Neopyropia yezoensis]
MEGNMGFITITKPALKQIAILKNDHENDVHLRIGVRQGGCSGMSYSMNFEHVDKLKDTDERLRLDNFSVVCDPKSLLYLYGLSLDFSSELIGGGFQFSNPNASQTCGCGKSFSG